MCGDTVPKAGEWRSVEAQMCSENRRETPEARPVWQRNLMTPMPLAEKLRLVRKNAWIKLSAPSRCCGNYGEPGC
ncbi:MAG TPA: hypothetical protein VLA05_10940 [Coriobacteriia bacterium]|nr:hypothetical protein [Coriobacteriia bacterium]